LNLPRPPILLTPENSSKPLVLISSTLLYRDRSFGKFDHQ
jgi:hypothetical protein